MLKEKLEEMGNKVQEKVDTTHFTSVYQTGLKH